MGVNENVNVNVNVNVPKIKNGSVITIGKIYSLKIKVDQHFNWFQKKMIKWTFGFNVEDYNG